MVLWSYGHKAFDLRIIFLTNLLYSKVKWLYKSIDAEDRGRESLPKNRMLPNTLVMVATYSGGKKMCKVSLGWHASWSQYDIVLLSSKTIFFVWSYMNKHLNSLNQWFRNATNSLSCFARPLGPSLVHHVEEIATYDILLGCKARTYIGTAGGLHILR